MPRYNKTRKVINKSEYYEFLRKERGVKVIEQYATPMLHNPTVWQRIYGNMGIAFISSPINIMATSAFGGSLRGIMVIPQKLTLKQEDLLVFL